MYKAPRGTQDILPPEQSYWCFVSQKAQEICQLYGYKRIETPMFEEAGLFQRGIGEGTDIVEKEMYTFQDHGGDLMTLRPEGTASVCRAYIENGMSNLPQPVRLYYMADIFRYERPQAGRYRQHHQFGCEAIGDSDSALDVEIIELIWRFYASLGLENLTLQLNSIGCPICRPDYVRELSEYYSQFSNVLCPNCKTRLARNTLRLLDCKEESCRKIAHDAPKIAERLCSDCDTNFQQVKHFLGEIAIPFQINPFLVRGLDYYTRTVFEIIPQEEGAQTALGGGGRYDLLIEQLGGKPVPAIGFAAGMERIILNLNKQGIAAPLIPEPKVYVAHADEEGKAQAVKLIAALRQAGIGAMLATGSRSLKAQLKKANAIGATEAVILGGDELKRGTVVLRNMAEGKQEEIPLGEVAKRLQGYGVGYDRNNECGTL